MGLRRKDLYTQAVTPLAFGPPSPANPAVPFLCADSRSSQKSRAALSCCNLPHAGPRDPIATPGPTTAPLVVGDPEYQVDLPWRTHTNPPASLGNLKPRLPESSFSVNLFTCKLTFLSNNFRAKEKIKPKINIYRPPTNWSKTLLQSYPLQR